MIRNTGACLADIFKWLCHRTMLTALRGAYRFTPAQAAIFIAARQPVFHTGQRQHVSTAGSLRLRSAKHCFRSSPPPCRMTMRRGSSLQARYARASGGQGCVQHCSMTEPFKKVRPKSSAQGRSPDAVRARRPAQEEREKIRRAAEGRKEFRKRRIARGLPYRPLP